MIENLIQTTSNNMKSGLNTLTQSAPLKKEEGGLEGQFKTLFNSFNKQLKLTDGEQPESESKESSVNDEPIESIEIKSNEVDSEKSLNQIVNRENNPENSEESALNDAVADDEEVVIEASESDPELRQAIKSNLEEVSVELKVDSESEIKVENTIDKPNTDIRVNKSEREIPLIKPDLDLPLHESESDSGPQVENRSAAEKNLMGDGEIQKQANVEEVLKFAHATESDDSHGGGSIDPNSGKVADQQIHIVDLKASVKVADQQVQFEDSEEATSVKVANQQINFVDS
ncbi:MAG: hypothetical protein WDZ38_06300, partial [Balneolaceae bacterium]